MHTQTESTAQRLRVEFTDRNGEPLTFEVERVAANRLRYRYAEGGRWWYSARAGVWALFVLDLERPRLFSTSRVPATINRWKQWADRRAWGRSVSVAAVRPVGDGYRLHWLHQGTQEVER